MTAKAITGSNAEHHYCGVTIEKGTIAKEKKEKIRTEQESHISATPATINQIFEK